MMSLLCLTSQAQEADSVLINVLLKKADSLYGCQLPEAALVCYQQVISLAEKGKLLSKYVAAAIPAGEILIARLDREAGVSVIRKALPVAERVHGRESEAVADGYFALAKYYRLEKNREQEAHYFENCLRLYHQRLGHHHPKVGYVYWNQSQTSYQAGKYQEAEMQLRKAWEAFFMSEVKDTAGMAKVLNMRGVVLSAQGLYRESKEAYLSALEMWQRQLGEDHENIGFGYNNVGLSYLRLGAYDEALEYLKCAVLARKETLGDEHAALTQSYNNLGLCYFRLGDLDHALANYEKALGIRLRTLGASHPLVATSYHNIAGVYVLLDEEKKALEYYEKARSIRQQALGHQHPQVADPYVKIGEIWARQGEDQRALDAYDAAMEIWQLALAPDHPDLLNLRVKRAACLGNLGAGPAQWKELNLALRYQQEAWGPRHPALARTLYEIGQYHRQQAKGKQGLEVLQQALVANSLRFTSPDPLQNPDLDDALSPLLLIRILIAKADVLREAEDLNLEKETSLQLARSSYRFADSTVRQLRNRFSGTTARQALAQSVQPLYEGAIETSLRLYRLHPEGQYLREIFEWMEKSKQGLLRESLQATNALQLADVPAEILRRETSLRMERAYWEDRLYQAMEQNPSLENKHIRECQNQLYALQSSYQALMEALARDFPSYYALRFSTKVPRLHELKTWSAQHHTSVISFFFGQTSLYAMGVEGDSIRMAQVAVNERLLTSLQTLLQSLRDPAQADAYGNDPAVFQRFIHEAKQVYDQLIRPVKGETLSRLVVIPDGLLAYLPFEVLLKSRPADSAQVNYADLDYLFRSSTVQYAFSGFFLLDSPDLPATARKTFAGFSPRYTGWEYADQQQKREAERGGAGWSTLAGGEAEVQDIASRIQGQAFVGAMATETAFRQVVSDFRMLHLAMHTRLDDRNPLQSALVFSPDSLGGDDGLLHIREIYSLRIAADLAVLSACETGVGRFRRGEGVMSLARAFRYAGCPNVLTSLWQADDHATSQLMKHFYAYLWNGESPEQALRSARISYLAASGQRHPHYWAAFVLVGDGKRREYAPGARSWTGWGLGAGLAALLVLVWLRKRILAEK